MCNDHQPTGCELLKEEYKVHYNWVIDAIKHFHGTANQIYRDEDIKSFAVRGLLDYYTEYSQWKPRNCYEVAQLALAARLASGFDPDVIKKTPLENDHQRGHYVILLGYHFSAYWGYDEDKDEGKTLIEVDDEEQRKKRQRQN